MRALKKHPVLVVNHARAWYGVPWELRLICLAQLLPFDRNACSRPIFFCLLGLFLYFCKLPNPTRLRRCTERPRTFHTFFYLYSFYLGVCLLGYRPWPLTPLFVVCFSLLVPPSWQHGLFRKPTKITTPDFSLPFFLVFLTLTFVFRFQDAFFFFLRRPRWTRSYNTRYAPRDCLDIKHWWIDVKPVVTCFMKEGFYARCSKWGERLSYGAPFHHNQERTRLPRCGPQREIRV